MKCEQPSLTERAALFVACGSLLCVGALVLFGVHQTITREKSLRWLLEGLLDPGEGGAILYPLIGIAAAALFFRSFVRKDRSE